MCVASIVNIGVIVSVCIFWNDYLRNSEVISLLLRKGVEKLAFCYVNINKILEELSP